MTSSKRMYVRLAAGTLLLLFYVHLQTEILRVSYSIEKKDRDAARLSEEYRTAKFRVTRLRSPHVLGEQMKRLALDLRSPKDQEIIRILKLRSVSRHVEPSPTPIFFQFLSRLHFIREAQAKTSKG